MKNNFEVGIIGGGPAGSTAAAFLADYGFEVCLFEKKAFPRETLCGEFLSAEVVHFLKELNLFKDFISLNPNKINTFRFFNTSGKNIGGKLNFDAYGLSRSSFDNLLLSNALEKGVTVFQPAEVKKIVPVKKSFKLLSNSEEKKTEIIVKDLIAAYGKQNPLDNFLERNFINRKSKLNGIKFHININELKKINEDEIRIYSADNIYCGVNAVDNGKVTFCFLEFRNYNQPPPRKQLPELRQKNKDFKELFGDNGENVFNDIPVYGTGNIYFGKRNVVENGIFMIGDAAGVIAPLAGDGIGIAMESGKLLAELFNKKRKESLSNQRTFDLYEEEWNKLFLKRMKTAKIIQNIILNNFGRKIGLGMVKIFPSLLPYLIKSTRNISGEKLSLSY
jgi:menaquinone-9 beta-reductase